MDEQLTEIMQRYADEILRWVEDHLQDYIDSLDRNEYEADYLDGLEDALITIRGLRGAN